MSHRRNKRLFAVAFALVFSSMMCEVPGSGESERLLEAQNLTSIAAEATRFSRDLTETAQASITPSATQAPTETPTPPPPTPTDTLEPTVIVPDFANLPPAVFSATDPAGDTSLCSSGASVDDEAVDIISVDAYDPAQMGFDHNGLLVRVGLGAPANETFALDWSAALLAAFAPEGALVYTVTVNQVHAGEPMVGSLDEAGQDVLPGTENHSFIDELGNIWFLIPRETRFLQLASFHSPTEDLPPEEKRCDVAPNEGQFTLDP